MSIKSTLTRAAEKITGRKCTRCLHNCSGRCCHPDGRMFMRCWQSITRPGFEYSEAVYFARTCGAAAAEGLKAGMEAKPAPLTPEQEHQLAKIRTMLQEAEDEARESGLLTED